MFTVCDHFTKWAYSVGTPNKEASTVSRVLYKVCNNKLDNKNNGISAWHKTSFNSSLPPTGSMLTLILSLVHTV